ncbi:MAG: EAL domain-containing protein [Pseudomonadota bacterium]
MNAKTLAPCALVADDDPVARRLLSELLRQNGFDVVDTGNGQEALAAAANRRPDLVVLDAKMPHVDGYSACAQMRQNEETSSVPIVIITGSDGAESVNQAYDAGATDFIVKPVNWPLLGHRLRYIMRNAGLTQALANSESANQALLRAIPDRILVLDTAGNVKRALDATGQHRNEASPQRVADLFPGYVTKRMLQGIQSALANNEPHTHEYADKKTGTELRYFEARYTPMDSESVLALIRDVTERKQAERKIHTLANFDPLTGLPNRDLFTERCSDALTEAAGSQERITVFHIDLDHFKRVNDAFGHDTGDELLRAVATRLSHCVRAGSARLGHCDVARFGGDEFVVFLRHAPADSSPVALARNIIKAMAEPFMHGETDVVVTPSIGVATAAPPEWDVQELLKKAATAVQSAKDSGRNTYRRYSEIMGSLTIKRICMESELRRALKNNEFEVHYQPKYDANTLELAGAEALLRWTHPQQGPISPGVFIPLAEESGLIVEVGAWMVKDVCRQLGQWNDDGASVPVIALNISGEEFRHGNPVQHLKEACDQAGVSPHQVEVEITESVLLHDIEAVRRCLQELRELGFSIAVDDFGVGYSSLAYLQTFPLSTLKIDRAFVREIQSPDDEAAICSAIVALGKSLKLKVVAEGIETDAQHRCLASKGCDLLQGFLFSKPLPAEQFAEQFNRPPLFLAQPQAEVRTG